jgi:hypothetical protein
MFLKSADKREGAIFIICYLFMFRFISHRCNFQVLPLYHLSPLIPLSLPRRGGEVFIEEELCPS